MAMKFRVLIERDEDGIYVAKVPDLPGKEAIRAYLETLKKRAYQPILESFLYLSID